MALWPYGLWAMGPSLSSANSFFPKAETIARAQLPVIPALGNAVQALPDSPGPYWLLDPPDP